MKIKEPNPFCNACGKSVMMDRLVSATGRPKFRGAGFYETDYKKNSNKSLDKASDSKDKKNE